MNWGGDTSTVIGNGVWGPKRDPIGTLLIEPLVRQGGWGWIGRESSMLT